MGCDLPQRIPHSRMLHLDMALEKESIYQISQPWERRDSHSSQANPEDNGWADLRRRSIALEGSPQKSIWCGYRSLWNDNCPSNCSNRLFQY